MLRHALRRQRQMPVSVSWEDQEGTRWIHLEGDLDMEGCQKIYEAASSPSSYGGYSKNAQKPLRRQRTY